MKILVVIDMQNDFVTGSLANKDAEAIISNVVAKVKSHIDNEDVVIFTMDTHTPDYLQTEEGKNLPVEHCIAGTEGWEIIDELQPFLDKDKIKIVKKETFGSDYLGSILKGANLTSFDEIEVIGICTDICVISNALLIKAFCPNTPIFVDESCCAGVTPESHRTAIEAMRACHIHI